MNPVELKQLEKLVVTIAREELLPRFTHVSSQQKQDGSLVTEADLVMQQQLEAGLKKHWPDISLLAEEMSPEQQQSALDSAQPLWCLDPLDGTTNYASGIPYYAVSLSLIVKGEVMLGLVYDPSRDECFSAEKDQPASLNGRPLQLQARVNAIKNAVALVDLKRLPLNLAMALAQKQPFASQRNFGASALDWCWLAAGRSHVYLHGRQNIWDYSAGSLIFQQAGGASCTLKAEPLFHAGLQGRSVVAAENPALLKDWYDWIQQYLA